LHGTEVYAFERGVQVFGGIFGGRDSDFWGNFGNFFKDEDQMRALHMIIIMAFAFCFLGNDGYSIPGQKENSKVVSQNRDAFGFVGCTIG
jgi:hypothetical protein